MGRRETPETAIDFVLPQWRRMEKIIWISTRGRSMHPLIQSTDRLAVRMMPPEKVRVGDVFAFRRDNGIVVVHRLMGRREDSGQWLLCEKGDNLRGCRWIRQEQVLGRVEKIERCGRLAVDLRSWPWPWINLIVGWSGYEGIVLSTAVRKICGRLNGGLGGNPVGPVAVLSRALRRAGRAGGLPSMVVLRSALKILSTPGPRDKMGKTPEGTSR